MNNQLTFGQTGNIIDEYAEKYTKEYCISVLNTDRYIWDMRCWDSRDRLEVEKWVATGGSKNCGHAMFCIDRLKRLEIPKDEIVNAIMENPNISYTKRLVKCWNNPTKCDKWVKYGCYVDDKGDSICRGCF